MPPSRSTGQKRTPHAENVAILRDGYDAFNRGDLEAALDGLDPQVEWRMPVGGADNSVYRGHDGVRKLFASIDEAWASYRAEPEEFIEFEQDRVLVLVQAVARGRGSGVEICSPVAHIWELRDGRALRIQMYSDRAEAFDTAGLR